MNLMKNQRHIKDIILNLKKKYSNNAQKKTNHHLLVLRGL